MNRRSFFGFFTAFLAVPSLFKPPKPALKLPTVPSGTILSFAGTKPPAGWVLCDGASYSLPHAIRDPEHSHTMQPLNFIQKV
jgi:tail collar domain